MHHGYVELDRVFRTLPPAETDAPADEFAPGFGKTLTWSDLLTKRRVVLLSEAGSGKTEEIRQSALKLLLEGRAAFFMRLEFVVSGFETAFEVGSFDAFETWLASDDDGWLFLDSVDEARLKSAKDFEAAVRHLGGRLKGAMGRVHIVITSRASAWRPISDRQLCRTLLPVPVANDTEVAADEAQQVIQPASVPRRSQSSDDGLVVVTLSDLDRRQIETFATAKGVLDTAAMVDAIERADAWSFASRPQDLSELVAFWRDAGRIGSRFELMRASIDRRLLERDPDRSEVRPLAKARAVEAARLLAGAASLTGRQTIDVPDAAAPNGKGLPVTTILPDWDEADLATLLSRPIFDDEIYGAVRFHHRSVREFLTAEWIANLLRRQTSRRRIEALFFRNQYGLEVIVPTLRPILPWLVLLDEGIRERVGRLAPEIFFEGGDPSQLPLTNRRAVLNAVCRRIAAGGSRQSVGDYDAVQRFALPDLACDIANLIEAYPDNEDILWILLRMVWQGQLAAALPQVLAVARNPMAPKYVRIAAFRAVAAVGSQEDIASVRRAFSTEPGKLRRDWLAELISSAPRSIDSVDWLIACLAKVAARDPHGIDEIDEAVARFVEEAEPSILAHLLRTARPLLSEPPVVERRHCEVSERFVWLLKPLAAAAAALARARHPTALEPAALHVFHNLPAASDYGRVDPDGLKIDLQTVLADWPELKMTLLWHAVAHTREELATDKGEALTDIWPVLVYTPILRFEPQDFDRVLAEAQTRPTLDDRRVALSLAFRLYVAGGRPRAWRNRLHRAATEPQCAAQLKGLLRPPPMPARHRRLNSMSRRWGRRDAARDARLAEDRRKSRDYLIANIEALRYPGQAPGVVTNAQLYLFNSMRAEDRNHYSISDWRSLIPEFGEPVARAFRDGVVDGWRRYAAPTLAQGAKANSIPYSAMIGLVGLAIESAEVEHWPMTLSPAEVEIAFRHAMHELNGLPPWLPRLFETFPSQVTELALAEIRFELEHGSPENDYPYLLHDINWSGQWAWDALAPGLSETILTKAPANPRALRRVLNILLGSSLSDTDLAVMAQQHATRGADERAAIWFAVWVIVAPDTAIRALAARLAKIARKKDRTQFAMSFLVHLVGGRRTEGFCRREGFRTAEHLKALYLIAHTHVAESDDIQRAGKGVYSPILRDDAQDARDQLFRWLKEIPGKPVFLAMRDIADQHPVVESRKWYEIHARAKAETDAVGEPWTPDQVRDFNATLERVPATNRELYDLTVLRLLDLKADLEDGDSSEATVLRLATREVDVRKYLGNRLRGAASGRYAVPQEEELADARRPDLRFHGVGFDAPVPIELKLADKWSGPALIERLESQLCGDYLRDSRSSLGVFVLVYRGEKTSWRLSEDGPDVDFKGLVAALSEHWATIAPSFAGVEDVTVVGIDLPQRTQ